MKLDGLFEVRNPYGEARARGWDVLAELESNPQVAGTKLDQLCAEIADRVRSDASSGVLYRLEGAHAEACTPMQYGGFFLDRDAELIAGFGKPTVVWVDAPGEAYVDFLATLPSELFAWDVQRSGVSVATMRTMRPTGLCADDPAADVQMSFMEAAGVR